MRSSLLSLLIALPLLAAAAPVHAAASPYLLPFPAGTSVAVTEGNSEGDHEAINGEQYAFDFMVAGVQAGVPTPVVAARAGTVIGTQSAVLSPWIGLMNPCPTFACWTRAAFVLVDQGDGTSALYESADPAVIVGTPVTQGTLIGQLMPSGLSVAPSLLFQVETTPATSARTKAGWWHTASLPVSFADPDVLAKVPGGVPTRQKGPYSPSVAESDPPINDVQINELTKQSGELSYSPVGFTPGYVLEEQNATVVAVDPDPKSSVVWFAATLDGSRLARTRDFGTYTYKGRDVPLYSYEGLTIWYWIDSPTYLVMKGHAGDSGAGVLVPGGMDNIAPYLQVGDVIWTVATGLTAAGGATTATKASMNRETLLALNRSVGAPNNRTSRAFEFYVDTITVAKDEN